MVAVSGPRVAGWLQFGFYCRIGSWACRSRCCGVGHCRWTTAWYPDLFFARLSSVIFQWLFFLLAGLLNSGWRQVWGWGIKGSVARHVWWSAEFVFVWSARIPPSSGDLTELYFLFIFFFFATSRIGFRPFLRSLDGGPRKPPFRGPEPSGRARILNYFNFF